MTTKRRARASLAGLMGGSMTVLGTRVASTASDSTLTLKELSNKAPGRKANAWENGVLRVAMPKSRKILQESVVEIGAVVVVAVEVVVAAAIGPTNLQKLRPAKALCYHPQTIKAIQLEIP